MKRMMWSLFLDLVDDALDPLLEHSAEHRAGNQAAHLKLDDMRIAKPCRNLFRFELDQTCETLDDRRLTDAGFTDEHRRIRPLAVREDLDHLQDLFLAADRRRDLVLPGKLVQRNAKMAKERRQLIFLPRAFLFLFTLADSGAGRLCDLVRRHAEILQNVIQDAALVIRKNVKNIAAVDDAASLRTGTVHRTFE